MQNFSANVGIIPATFGQILRHVLRNILSKHGNILSRKRYLIIEFFKIYDPDEIKMSTVYRHLWDASCLRLDHLNLISYPFGCFEGSGELVWMEKYDQPTCFFFCFLHQNDAARDTKFMYFHDRSGQWIYIILDYSCVVPHIRP